MSSNNICALPKESDAPSEKVENSSGDLDYSKKALVATTDTIVKEGNTYMVDNKKEKNLMWWRNPSLLLFQQKIILTQ